MPHPKTVHATSELSPAEVENTTDKFKSLVHELISQVCGSSHVRSVFGEPVTRGEVTIIPVASVYAGFGAGLGLGSNAETQSGPRKGGGMGLGGGYVTQPLGVWEITQHGVEFRRVRPLHPLASLVDIALSLVRRSLG